MADWRQIQARIRKAKGGSNPAGELAELYERTHDAMVAFELAVWYEKAGGYADAARWYSTAAERFRRAQWRTKAAEALARLGAPVPAALPESTTGPEAVEKAVPEPEHATLFAVPSSETAKSPEAPEAEPSEEQPGAVAPDGRAEATAVGKKRRRRGRRGGRKRRRGREADHPAASEAPAPDLSTNMTEPSLPSAAEEPHSLPAEQESALDHRQVRERSRHAPSAPPAWQGRARAGEPALASRIAQLESQLRRLLACPMLSLANAEQAPAGPGVLLLSDSDQVTHYYVEACQTLRIGVANLLRGGRGSKDGGRLKARMAENLGIGESRVSKYLKDHCAVRWLQLDEGASELAHFAIAVLAPVVNE